MSAPEKTKTGATGQGRIVVISGPSGSGKTTVCDRLLAEPGFVLSVSATTRKPRPGERDGVTYHFMDRDEFVARAGRGEFAEHAEYNGHLYGTPREPLERAVAQDKTVLVEIDVQGAAQMRRQYPDAIYIFLDAPNDEAAARLELRNTETAGERQRRVDAARRERAQAKRYFDFRVVNDKLDEAVETVKKIIAGEQVAGTHL